MTDIYYAMENDKITILSPGAKSHASLEAGVSISSQDLHFENVH